jgi:hypothetical protein
MHSSIEKTVRPCRQPRRYKLALLTFAGLLAPVYFIPPALSALLGGPRLLTVSVAVAVIVALMSYVIMPLLTRFASLWLFESDYLLPKNSEDKKHSQNRVLGPSN